MHIRAATLLAVVACVGCAPPEELGGARTAPDVTTTVRQLVTDVEIDGPLVASTLTLSLDERVVWSCVPERSCAADDVWYHGPGLYTFAMGDDLAADVFVEENTVRLQLDVRGELRDGELELWYVNARAFADGNDVARLERANGSWSFANTSGVELMKQSMTAALERWDGDAWRDVPRAPIFLCGTGWNPRVDVDEVERVYLPLGAHRRAMAAESIETTGTYRVRYPFRVIDEEQPRMASLVIELDEQTFDPSAAFGD